MADKNLNIKVGLKGHKQTEQGLKGVEGAISKVGKAVGIASVAYFGATGLIAGFGKIINLAGEQEKAEKSLEVALGRRSKALLDQASALQQVTTFGDEAIIGVQASIGAFLDSEEQIKKATEATLDIAVAMGMDLKSAGDLVAKTLGSSTNAMSRYGIQVEGAVGSTERLESLTNNVSDLFGGQAKAQAETMAGSLEQMKNSIGDAGEALGELLAPMVITTAKGIKTLAEGVGTVITRFKNFGKEVDAVLLDKTALAQQEIEKFRASIQGLSQEDLKNQLDAMNKANEGMVVFTSTMNNQVLMSGQLTKSQELENQKAEVLYERYQELNNILGLQKKTMEELDSGLRITTDLRKSDLETVLESDEAYQTFLATAQAKVDAQDQEALFNTRLIASNKELAESLGLVKTKTEESGYSWDVFNKNLDTAVAGSIATASSISSTSDALGSAGEAAKQASVSFVSAEIQKAVSSYISKFMTTTPLPPFVSAPLALAGGAAFGSLMSSAIQRNFAEGGIVEGNPSAGDSVPAMLTPGEVILNQAQQENLTGGMGGITLNISAPLVDETILDVIIPKIKEAQRMDMA